MATTLLVLVLLQALGAVVGAVSAVVGEWVYIKALRDGHVDRAERLHLDSLAKGLRFGMLLLLLSSFGLLISAYVLQSSPTPAETPAYWILIVLSLLTVWGSWALSRKRISFAYGSAIVFSAWWFLAYLTLGWLPPLTFGAFLAAFIVVTAIFYLLLRAIRHVASRPARLLHK